MRTFLDQPIRVLAAAHFFGCLDWGAPIVGRQQGRRPCELPRVAPPLQRLILSSCSCSSQRLHGIEEVCAAP
eukprot:9184658-Karenia_brevis.AAC.1